MGSRTYEWLNRLEAAKTADLITPALPVFVLPLLAASTSSQLSALEFQMPGSVLPWHARLTCLSHRAQKVRRRAWPRRATAAASGAQSHSPVLDAGALAHSSSGASATRRSPLATGRVAMTPTPLPAT